MLKQADQKKLISRAGLSLLFALCICLLLPQALVALENSPVYQPQLELDLTAQSAIVLDTGRARRLYAKNADIKLSIPAAAKLMAALLACERLPLDTPVTISNVAAQAASQEVTGDGLVLHTGDKYPLEYLLLRLLFYDSNAAVLAIAEQISNEEERFVELMNARAAALGLNNTLFLNSTGDHVYEKMDNGQELFLGEDESAALSLIPLQYSTVSDLARLATVAMNNQTFAKAIRKDSEYLVLPGNTLASMKNSLQAVWTLSENKITGAYYAGRAEQAYMLGVARINDFNVVIVTANGSANQRINDLLAVVNLIEKNYIQTPLVEKGELFSGNTEQTTDGEEFNLVFLNTVNYIRPADDMFLEQSVLYISRGPHHRPIESSMVVGQVLFTLKDGTVIAVDVGPDRQILSGINILNKLLSSLQSNKNLFYMIMLSGILLCLLMLYHISRLVLQLAVQLRQIRHNRRSPKKT